jgi:hypothetical protein
MFVIALHLVLAVALAYLIIYPIHWTYMALIALGWGGWHFYRRRLIDWQHLTILLPALIWVTWGLIMPETRRHNLAMARWTVLGLCLGTIGWALLGEK